MCTLLSKNQQIHMTKIWKESAQIIFFGYSRGTLCYVYLFDMITNSSNSRQYVVKNSTLVYHNTLHCWCVQYNSTTM